jgi:alpha-ribazole phosphatase
MTQLYLARHGETEWNVKQRFQGQSDISLNENGRCQAADLAQRLAEETINAIYASNLSRAWETAEAIAEHHTCPVIAEPGLREAHFGKWEGSTYAEIQASDPEAVQAWHEDMANFAPPEGETLDQLARRVSSAYANIIQQHNDDETILLVAHGGSLQMLITQLMGLAPAQFLQFHLNPCSLSIVSVYDQTHILNLLNDTCHLKKR